MRQSLSEEEAKGIKSLIEEGSKITGPAMGAAIGFLLGGPIGAAIGGGSAYLLQKGMIAIGNDIGKRFLGEREKMRIGGVTMYAADKIQKNLALGMKLRDDGFFEQPQPRDNACIELPILERPPDEEIIEGILLAVQREHEEKKLPFIGNLLANIFFDSSIDKEQANLMIKISETITFTQMCLLAIFSEPYKSKINGRFSGNSAFPKGDENLNSLFQEIFDLGSQSLLYRSKYEPVTKASHLNIPMEVDVVGAGSSLYKLMELGTINETYLDAIAFKIFPKESEKYPPEKRNSVALMKK